MSTAVEDNCQMQLIDEKYIENKIYVVRDVQVMLDFDLAEIYGYEVKRLNEQVKRNSSKFPEDFMFQLTRDEVEVVKSQFATSRNLTLFSGQDGGVRKLPYAFTEQGIYMLATVLHGELAVMQSIALIRAFKHLKDYVLRQNALSSGVNDVIALQTAQNMKDIELIKETMLTKSDLSEIINNFSSNSIVSEYLILENELIEAQLAYKQIYSKAKNSLYIIDNYINLKTLMLFREIDKSVSVIVFTDNYHQGLSLQEYNDFNSEYGIPVDFKMNNNIIHDRYIVIDYNTSDEKIYHCGASSKDAGKKVTTISLLSDSAIYHSLIGRLLQNQQLILR